MTIMSTAPAAAEWLHELADARTEYEERLGWPVGMDVTNRQLVVLAGRSLGALIMPARLGHHVLTELRIAMLAGPVLEGADRRWMFLTEPVPDLGPEFAGELGSAGVDALPPGAPLVLPRTVDDAAWIERPQPAHALPPAQAVLGVTRRVLG
jgi:hypothetical protein